MTFTRNVIAKLPVVAALVLGGLSLGGCATKEYVNEQISAVNMRISGVDAKASDALQRANAANATAEAAQASASSANQRIDALSTRVDTLQAAPPPPRRTPRG